MGGTSKQSTQQTQSSTTAPWAPTQPLLGQIITGLQGQYGQTTPTGAEQNAITSLQNNAASLPNYTSQAAGLLNNLFSGGTDRTGIVNNAYSQYQNQLSPYANGNPDPTQTPGIQNVLNTIQSDVGNSINGLFAGAGRDLSGAHTQALARGISQGEAVPLLNQYNQNVQNQLGAAGNLFAAGGQTAGLLSGLDQTALGNQLQGLSTVPSITQADAGANAALQAGQISRGLPLSNIGQLLNLILPIAGLGGQSTGQGQSTTYNTMSPVQTALGWTQVGTNALNLGKSLFSDRRLKTEIKQVGELYDGTPVYRFRYLPGDGPTVIGLMADEVTPEAVTQDDHGFKMVDYEVATQRAADLGAR